VLFKLKSFCDDEGGSNAMLKCYATKSCIISPYYLKQRLEEYGKEEDSQAAVVW